MSSLNEAAALMPRKTVLGRAVLLLRRRIRGRSTVLKVRRALLFYALKRLGLDVAPETRPPNEQHIVLVNREAVDSVLVRARRGRPDIF